MNNDIMVSVRLPKDLGKRTDDTALEEGRSRSGMIRRILDRYPETFDNSIQE